MLNRTYAVTAFPTPEMQQELSRVLHVTPRKVRIWFQNARQRRPPDTTWDTNRFIQYLAGSVALTEDPCDDEHASSISMWMGTSVDYVRVVVASSF